MTENTVAISESELDELRERAREAERSTRERSPIKPQDHKPAADTKLTVEYLGESYEFDSRSFKSPYVIFAFKREDLQVALEQILGADSLERAIESTKDDDGYPDMERLAGLVEKLAEAANSKNF